MHGNQLPHVFTLSSGRGQCGCDADRCACVSVPVIQRLYQEGYLRVNIVCVCVCMFKYVHGVCVYVCDCVCMCVWWRGSVTM